MIYQLLKAIHITSVITFIAGLLVLSISARFSNLVVHGVTLRWDRHVTLPALILVWVTGLVIATKGGWFGDGWLNLKLVFVAGLSAVHGMLAGALSRIEHEICEAPMLFTRYASTVTLISTLVIALLVILKPLR